MSYGLLIISIKTKLVRKGHVFVFVSDDITSVKVCKTSKT